LHPSVNVDVHHYDRRGTTPLMAFIEHISDDQDDKAKTLQTIIETLIRAGGPRCVEARNRRAETPLLLAARLGRKVALAVLLEHGANVHVRDVDGRGLLEVLDREVDSARARSDVSLYARLEACRVLLTGRRDWGVQYKGGIVREWRVRK
jgi:ankyrin repeat protein